MLKPSRHKRGAKDDKLAHINFDATECQGFKEMVGGEGLYTCLWLRG